MTNTHPLHPAEAGALADKAATPAGADHAFVRDGRLYVREFGRFEPTTRFSAVCLAASLRDSPFQSSRDRAREIMAAAQQVTQ